MEFFDSYTDYYIDSTEGISILIYDNEYKVWPDSLFLPREFYAKDRLGESLLDAHGDFYIPIQNRVFNNGEACRVVNVEYEISDSITRLDYITLSLVQYEKTRSLGLIIKQGVKSMEIIEMISWANDFNDRIMIDHNIDRDDR